MDYAAIAQMLLSLAGNLQASGKQQQAQALLQKSYDEFGNLSLPHFERAIAQTLGPSALEAIKADPRISQAQSDTLTAYDDVIAGNGFDNTDKAALNAVGNSVARRLAGNNSMLRQRLEAGGMGNSGEAVAASLANQQQANDRLASAGMEQAAQGEARRMQAIQSRAAEAQRQRDSNWNERSAVANAKDRIEAFNAAARSSATAQNNANAQAGFDNAYRRTAGKAGQAIGVAGGLNQMGADQASTMAKLGAGMAEGARSMSTTYGPASGGYSPPPMVSYGDDSDEWARWPGQTRDKSIWGGW